MSQVRVSRAADRHPQRWKNGGGLTSEVASFPAEAGVTDFDWRISIAEVAQAGPFSCFDGVDRVLTVLEGELDLTFHDPQNPVALTNQSAPFHFAGDVPVSGAPRGGPVRDLNVMVRRDKASAKVARIALAPDLWRELELPAQCILVAQGDLTLRVENKDHRLADLDAVLVEGPSAALAATYQDAAGLIVIAINRVAGRKL